MNLARQLLQKHWYTLDARARKIFLALLLAIIVLAVALVSSAQTTTSITPVSNGSSSNSGGSSSYSSGAGSSGSYASNSGSETSSNLATHILVDVVGQVNSPGVYQLATGARVLDAIFAAGGFTKKANQASVNLARLANDGEQIIVLGLSSSAGQSDTSGLGETLGGQALINLNQADAASLDTLPGIGPTLAARIVDYRKLNGGFTSLDDLGKVAGIGASLLANIKGLVTF